MRKLAILGVAALFVAAGCSSSNTASTTTTAPPATSASTSSTTAAGSSSKPDLSKITKPATIEKIDRSKLPAKTQSIPVDDFTSDEQDCIFYVAYLAGQEDAELASNDAKLAGVTGAAMVVCVPQDKIATFLTLKMKAANPSFTETQLQCVYTEITAASKDDLSLFLGFLVYGDKELLKPFEVAFQKACNLPAS